MVPLVPAFRKAYPQITLQLDTDETYIDLLERRTDVAIRIGQLPDSTLHARPLCTSRLRVLASPDYLALRGTPLKPEDLATHDCLPYGHGRQVQWRFKGKVQALSVSGRMRVNNGDLLRDTAIAGLGVTYLPTFIVSEALKDGRLVKVLEDFAPEALTLSAVYPQHRQSSRPVQALVEFLRERLASGC